MLCRNPDLIDIVITDRFKTVFHCQVTADDYQWLTARNPEPWAGRIVLHNVCQILRWRNRNGFTGLLALGPIENQHGGCTLGVRAPQMTIDCANITGACAITDRAQIEFWKWHAEN